MLKKDADKKYLASKVAGYIKQGDKDMAERFIKAYLYRVGISRSELDKQVKKILDKDKPQKKDEKIIKKEEKENDGED